MATIDLVSTGNVTGSGNANLAFLSSLSSAGNISLLKEVSKLAYAQFLNSTGISSTLNSATLDFIFHLSSQGVSSTTSENTLLSFTASLNSTGNINLLKEVSNLAYAQNINSSGYFKSYFSGNLGFPLSMPSATGFIYGSGSGLISVPLSMSSTGDILSSLFANATIEQWTQEELDKKEDSFFIGNVEIPLLVSKDESVSRETIINNFVDHDSDVFQRTPSFKVGTYSAYLNQEAHSKDKTIEEQFNDLRKITNNRPEENEIEYPNGKAYAAVQSISDVIDVNQEIKEVEIEMIILEDI